MDARCVKFMLEGPAEQGIVYRETFEPVQLS
jgi:hypothetical protein